MSKKKDKAAAGEGTEGGARSGKVKTVGMAVGFVVLGALIGPKVLGGGSAPAGATEGTTTTTAAGPVVVLDAVTLNLADGHLLQVGLALELDPNAEAAGGAHGEKPDESDPTKGYAKAIDATIDVLGDETMATLSAPGGREAAKSALEGVLHDLYEGEIVGVYFHQFVMQ
jgi:flagellar FliL protein